MRIDIVIKEGGNQSMIGNRIKELREKHNYTQSALAKRLGLSRSAINAWEMGISIPSTHYIVELAELFKISTDYLLGASKKEFVDITELSLEEKELIYSLLTYFKSHQTALKILDDHGLTRLFNEQENP